MVSQSVDFISKFTTCEKWYGEFLMDVAANMLTLPSTKTPTEAMSKRTGHILKATDFPNVAPTPALLAVPSGEPRTLGGLGVVLDRFAPGTSEPSVQVQAAAK